jgi:hypothetical protein
MTFNRLLLSIIFFTLLTLKSAFSQPIFKNDTSYKPFSQNLAKEIDSNFHLEKNVDFEMSFWTLISKTMERRLFVLSLNNGKWTARLFKKTYYLTDTLVEVSISQKNLEKLWKNLNKNNLLTISEEFELRDKKGNEINDRVHDGISYSFEFISKKNKRGYWYHCPKRFSEEYKYIKEYKYVLDIIRLIYKHCLVQLNIC